MAKVKVPLGENRRGQQRYGMVKLDPVFLAKLRVIVTERKLAPASERAGRVSIGGLIEEFAGKAVDRAFDASQEAMKVKVGRAAA